MKSILIELALTRPCRCGFPGLPTTLYLYPEVGPDGFPTGRVVQTRRRLLKADRLRAMATAPYGP